MKQQEKYPGRRHFGVSENSLCVIPSKLANAGLLRKPKRWVSVEKHQDLHYRGWTFMAQRELTDSEILAQIPAARRRARREPAAEAVRYERSKRRIQVRLTNGALLTVPIDLIEAVRGANESEIGNVRLGPAGVSLRWERLDEDVSISALARVVLGKRALMRASGSAGGASTSAAKARAARENGKRGGRPPLRDGRRDHS